MYFCVHSGTFPLIFYYLHTPTKIYGKPRIIVHLEQKRQSYLLFLRFLKGEEGQGVISSSEGQRKQYQNLVEKGPIPEGIYYANQKGRQVIDPWNAGWEKGSAGCIDIPWQTDKLWNYMDDCQEQIPVYVKYPNENWL